MNLQNYYWYFQSVLSKDFCDNLIKFGTTAPSELLREMYENSKLCGEISNNNPTNIVHNFKQS